MVLVNGQTVTHGPPITRYNLTQISPADHCRYTACGEIGGTKVGLFFMGARKLRVVRVIRALPTRVASSTPSPIRAALVMHACHQITMTALPE